MAQFDEEIQTALELIKENGMQVSWCVLEGETDTQKPWQDESQMSTPNLVDICFIPATSGNLKSLGYLPESNIPTASELGLMGNVPFEPSLKDYVLRNGVKLEIAYIDILQPNGQKILYTVLFK